MNFCSRVTRTDELTSAIVVVLNTHIEKHEFVTLVPKWLLILVLQTLQMGAGGRPHACVQCLNNNLTLTFQKQTLPQTVLQKIYAAAVQGSQMKLEFKKGISGTNTSVTLGSYRSLLLQGGCKHCAASCSSTGPAGQH